MDFEEILLKFKEKENNYLNRISTQQQRELKVQKVKKAPNKQASLVDLKLFSKGPDLVQFDDINGPCPYFLNFLRQQHSTVDIPQHWRSVKARIHQKQLAQYIDFQIPNQMLKMVVQRKQEVDKMQQQSFQQKTKSELMTNQLDKQLYDFDENTYLDSQQYLQYGEVYYQGKQLELKYKYDFERGKLSESLKQAIHYIDGEIPIYQTRMQQLEIKPE